MRDMSELVLAKEITIGEKYDPAMTITNQQDADQYFEACVRHTMSFGKDRKEAEQIERMNIGYYAGYCSHSTRARVERLFHCAHPIFGAIAIQGPPTPSEAYSKGLKLGQDMKRRP